MKSNGSCNGAFQLTITIPEFSAVEVFLQPLYFCHFLGGRSFPSVRINSGQSRRGEIGVNFLLLAK